MALEKSKEKCSKIIENYRYQRQRTKKFFKSAQRSSTKEIRRAIAELKDNKSPAEAIKLLKILTTSSAWIGHSLTRHTVGLFDFKNSLAQVELNQNDQNIIKDITEENLEGLSAVNDTELFTAIYKEIQLDHIKEDYTARIECPEVNVTLVIIDGVLNEIFSKSAFERGADHLSETKGIKYFVPEVRGTKSSKYNAELIYEQLKDYIEQNPNEKLWLLSFSKGGLDSLHFLKEHSEFANDYILGLSTIACPIIGSDKVNHKLLKQLDKVHSLSDTKIYQYLDSHFDILFKNLIYSLATHYQAPWFRENHEKLPKGIFYTAFAMESEWYESHFWMALTKLFFQSKKNNDGIVDTYQAQFPSYFNGINLGVHRGHHLIGTRSSFFIQEALLESHLIFLKIRGYIS